MSNIMVHLKVRDYEYQYFHHTQLAECEIENQ